LNSNISADRSDLANFKNGRNYCIWRSATGILPEPNEIGIMTSVRSSSYTCDNGRFRKDEPLHNRYL